VRLQVQILFDLAHIGARRHFFVEQQQGNFVIRARNIYTEQLITKKKRKTVREWIENRVDPKHPGKSETEHTVQTGKSQTNSQESS